MVADLVAGAIIGAVSSLIGAFGTGYINLQQAKVEQHRQDNRVVAQEIVSQEAEAIQELSFQLNRLHRDYEVAVRMAANRYLTESEYQEKYNLEFRELQVAIDRATPFLNEYGERMLNKYANHLVEADSYARQYSRPEEETGSRDGAVEDLLELDSAELDWREWQRDYDTAKEALRESINANLRLLSNRE